jgi:hypothetical protein
MSRRTTKQTEALIREQLPGYKLSPESSMAKKRSSPAAVDAAAARDARRARRVDAATPSIADLRRKFLGSDAADAADAAMAADEATDADIVLVEPAAGSPGRRQRKAVVISATGKVLGAQG